MNKELELIGVNYTFTISIVWINFRTPLSLSLEHFKCLTNNVLFNACTSFFLCNLLVLLCFSLRFLLFCKSFVLCLCWTYALHKNVVFTLFTVSYFDYVFAAHCCKLLCSQWVFLWLNKWMFFSDIPISLSCTVLCLVLISKCWYSNMLNWYMMKMVTSRSAENEC